MQKTVLLAAVAILLASCTKQSAAPQVASLEDIDRLADNLRQSILTSERPVAIAGTVYYVSAQGNDSNDGLSPETPLQSLEAVNNLAIKPGDGVLFHRGDLWRGYLIARTGATYGAYGSGEKPQLYGSPCDAAIEGTWTETETPNVYAYSLEVWNDVGTLVFNHGEAHCAFKVVKRTAADGSTTHAETGEPFASYADLKRDLDFYHDYKGTGLIYLRSDKGNPAQRFKSIEMNPRFNLVQVENNVHIDNLCLKYCGAHAIGAGTVNSLSVSQCEIGWVGGSIQGETIFGRDIPTRYGNGVEIYGGCDSFSVDSCYVYQIYDAALTHQHLSNGDNEIKMRNVSYTHNLIEDCVYSIEYFVGSPRDGKNHVMENFLIADNITRRAGMGWGKQRPDKETPAHIKSWRHGNPARNFIVTRNIFDRSAQVLLNIEADSLQWLPKLEANVYVQTNGAQGGQLSYAKPAATDSVGDMFWNQQMKKGNRQTFDNHFADTLRHLFGEDKATIIALE